MKEITDSILCTRADMHSAADILAENARRLAALQLEFDPVSGLNSIGRRFRLDLPDYIQPTQWLPDSMRGEELIADLLRHGSIAATASARGESPTATAELLLRTRMLHDFPFWAALTVYIKNKGGGPDVRFRLNAPQRRLVAAFERARLARRPLRLILLKARQWGGSTCAQIYMAWLQLMHSTGLNSLIIAHQGAGSDEIKDMFDRMIRRYPAALLYSPEQQRALKADARKQKKIEGVGRSGAIFRVPQRNCKIKIGTAERPDSCRGGDYNLVHLSEVGIWRATEGKSPEDIVRSACGGVLLQPLTMIVYESTANGTGNFFHNEYLAARRGESQFEAMFVSWYEIEKYTLPLTAEEELQLATRLWEGRDSDADTARSESGRYLYSLFKRGATLQAISWYIAERAKYSDHARMAAEYPSDDTEAFAHSGARVFDRYEVEALRAGCTDPLDVGEVESTLPDGPGSLDDIRFISRPSGGMKVWSHPDTVRRIAGRYLAVVDIGGRGARADWSVITVIDRAPMLSGGVPEIAAQWRGHCDADILAWRSARIARYYADALLVVESNTLETREVNRSLDAGQLPYILLQIRDEYQNIYMRPASPEDVARGVSRKLGFHTNAVTKPMVIATLVRVVREGLYTERASEALDEMLSYERRPNGSYGAIAGHHDDILMTRAIGLHIALHEMEPPRHLPVLQPHSQRQQRHRPMNEASF